LLTYIFLIFIFAFVYDHYYSGKFYHATLRYEAEYDVLKSAVLEDIKTSIMSNFSSANNSYSKTIPREFTPVYLHIDKIHLENLEVKDDGLHFMGHFYFSDMHHFGPGKGRPTTYNYFFNLRNNSKTIHKSGFGGESREISVETNHDNPIDAIYIIPPKNELTNPSITFSDDQLRTIGTLTDYSNGVIRQNSFKRMLYFSAITISTIGYGDIVPIDDQLRLLVGLEATLGIIFIGLFINALAGC